MQRIYSDRALYLNGHRGNDAAVASILFLTGSSLMITLYAARRPAKAFLCLASRSYSSLSPIFCRVCIWDPISQLPINSVADVGFFWVQRIAAERPIPQRPRQYQCSLQRAPFILLGHITYDSAVYRSAFSNPAAKLALGLMLSSNIVSPQSVSWILKQNISVSRRYQ